MHPDESRPAAPLELPPIELPPTGRDLRFARGLGLVVALVLAGGAWIGAELHEAGGRIAALSTHRLDQPTRLYARPLILGVGDRLPAGELVALLDDLQYHEIASDLPVSGTYRLTGDGLVLRRRSFPAPHDGSPRPAADVEIAWRRSVIERLSLDGAPVLQVVVDLPLLASFYGSEVRECRPVRLTDLPAHVVHAFLAAEDAGFYEHGAVSPIAILRAAWINFREGEVRQGGSTITQQLVKNLFLTHERTLARKYREVLMAWALERRLSKERILEIYLNEIYLGASGAVNLIGVGAASRAYFGKDATELDLVEAATLAAMVPAPARLDPRTRPDLVAGRRDSVIVEMADRGWISAAQAGTARRSPVVVRPTHPGRRLAPHFAALAADEARRRFGLATLDGKGLSLFSTLDLRDQRRAERNVSEQLVALERRKRARPAEGAPLEAALVSADPRSGELLAWVGGRDWERSEFDRARQARRQPGSAFKPVVFAAALEDGVAQPWQVVDDSPVIVRYGEEAWEPRNNDRVFRGPVTVRSAFEKSLNVPTVRLAVATGLYRIAALAERMGSRGITDVQPSLALGAVDLSVVEVTAIYATLASGGVAHAPHALLAVSDADGLDLRGEPLPLPERVLHEATAYQVTSLMRGVVDHGTGWGVRRIGLRDPLAGKTGTSSERRDSWFAGFSTDRVTVVWVGYDDNRPTGFEGSRGALPLWAAFMRDVRPAEGYPEFEVPSLIESVSIDPATGLLATAACAERITESLPVWHAPLYECPCGAWRWGLGLDPLDVALGPLPSEREGTIEVAADLLDPAARRQRGRELGPRGWHGGSRPRMGFEANRPWLAASGASGSAEWVVWNADGTVERESRHERGPDVLLVGGFASPAHQPSPLH